MTREMPLFLGATSAADARRASPVPAPPAQPGRRRAAASLACMLAAPPTLWAGPAGRQPTPSQMEGPFYPLALPAEHDADLLSVGGRTLALADDPQRVLLLSGTVQDLDGAALSGAVVELWQCDHQGRYHHPGDGNRADPGFQGFGMATVDRQGRYRFRTLLPVPYPGRTPHIHLKVKLGRMELLTTQMYLAGHPGNAADGLYRRLSPAERAALSVSLTRGTRGWVGEFPLVVSA